MANEASGHDLGIGETVGQCCSIDEIDSEGSPSFEGPKTAPRRATLWKFLPDHLVYWRISPEQLTDKKLDFAPFFSIRVILYDFDNKTLD